jgi:hypothetical protein
MVWPVRDIERDRDTIIAIEAHDDRAAATLAGAYLENRLEITIKAHDESSLRAKATFKEKIAAAYRQGIIEEKMRDVLNAIRAIRDEFVHSEQRRPALARSRHGRASRCAPAPRWEILSPRYTTDRDVP